MSRRPHDKPKPRVPFATRLPSRLVIVLVILIVIRPRPTRRKPIEGPPDSQRYANANARPHCDYDYDYEYERDASAELGPPLRGFFGGGGASEPRVARALASLGLRSTLAGLGPSRWDWKDAAA